MRWLCCHSLEKGIAEHAIGFCRAIEIADPRIECRGIDDAGRECVLPYGFNHPRECFPRETVDQIQSNRPARPSMARLDCRAQHSALVRSSPVYRTQLLPGR